MMALKGQVLKIDDLGKKDKDRMYSLMDMFYDDTSREVFDSDLNDKDYCIVLKNTDDLICGFTTQKLLTVKIREKKFHGVFSGDTIIHKDYWGSMEMFKVFARFFFEYGSRYDDFYWFLISKGYKTYKILPTFFETFYPNYKEETPAEIKDIMDAYGSYCYPGEYDKKDGVIHYISTKDKLKKGVADITGKRLRDPDVSFFIERNPGYIKGEDLVCIANLKREHLKRRAERILL